MTASTFNSAGVSLIRFDDILANSIAAAKASWDESIDCTINDAQDAFLGHLLRNVALDLSDINEIIQDIYDTGSVTNSYGARLDHLLSLIGLTRASDAASTAVLTLTASKATTVPAGSQYKTVAGVIFSTDVALVFTAAGSSTVASTCTIFGANDAAIGEINTIVTNVDGITAVTNAAAAIPGRLRATDTEQKANHTIAVATAGEGDDASIYEALIADDMNTTAVSVVSNPTTATVDGVPAYHLHCVCIGGTDADIAEAIHITKTNSVPTHGSENVVHYDPTSKQTETINFDRGTAIPIYITVGISLSAGLYPDDYEAQIRANYVTHFSDFRIGEDVLYNSLFGSVTTIAGVTLNSLTVGVTPAPGGSVDVAMSATELAQMTTAQAATAVVINVT